MERRPLGAPGRRQTHPDGSPELGAPPRPRSPVLVADVAIARPAGPVVVLELNATSALGGGPKIMLDLVRGLHRDRFTPVAIAPNDGPYYARFRELGVPVVDLALRSVSPARLRTVVATVRRHR